MPRRSQPKDPEKLRLKLVELLTGFERHLQEDGLRAQVLALIPAFHALRDLGSSLIPINEGGRLAARSRILHYLLKYPYMPVRGDELMVVSGIQDYPRRIRELRVEHGWQVMSGGTAKEMAEA